MKFIEALSNLKEQYSDNFIIRKNGTTLLSPNKIPRCKHMLFKPLEDRCIYEYLVPYFENLCFPEEYIDLLRYSNGADLFGIKINAGRFSFANQMLIVLGLPLTPTSNRPLDMEEPADIRVENLARHKKIPDYWLKCAIWTENKNIGIGEPTDVFIDTISHEVFACQKNKSEILYKWNDLDECLCSILDSFKDLQDEYQINF